LAYKNDVLPKAEGLSARIRQEAEAYKQKVIAGAEGEANRFKAVLVEYEKAPRVTRDRMYLDTVQQVYSNTSKVMLDAKSASPLLALPLDKLISQGGAVEPVVPRAAAPVEPSPAPTSAAADARSREAARNRERESR
jgi:modulator of FtsH protease HflK